MSQVRFEFGRSALCALALFLPGGVVHAGDDHHHDHDHYVEAGAHEHGRGSLDIVVEGNLVLAELHAPSFDILGFEYAATTKSEKEAARAARDVLAKPLTLLGPSGGAACAVSSMSVEFGGEKSADAAGALGHDAATTADHAHEDSHDGHEHGVDHAANREKSTHSEVRASYTLNCASASKLETLTLTYFDTFSNARSLSVNIVSPNGQFAQEVTRAQPVIRVARGGS